MSEVGNRYRMHTGEVVEIAITRFYETPQGELPQHTLRFVEPHVFRTTKEVNGRFVPTTSSFGRGATYHMTPAELARNGERIVNGASL